MDAAILRSEFWGMKGDLPPQAVEQLKFSREHAAQSGFFNNTVWTVGPVVAALAYCICASVVHVFNGIRDVILYPSYLFDPATPITVWNIPAHVLRILIWGGVPFVEKLADAVFCVATGSVVAVVVVAFSIFGQGAEAHRLLDTQKFKNNDPIALRAALGATEAARLKMQNERDGIQRASARVEAGFTGQMEGKDRELGDRARVLHQQEARMRELEALAFPGFAQFQAFRGALAIFQCGQDPNFTAADAFLVRLQQKIQDPTLDPQFDPSLAEFIQAYNVLYPIHQGAGEQQAYVLEQLNFLHPFTQSLNPWNELMRRNPRHP